MMGKGVSTVIATILMLIITIALAGVAWGYIQGIFNTQTQGLEVVDVYCVKSSQPAGTGECPAGTSAPPCDQVKIIIRNIGTSAVSTNGITVTQTAPSSDSDTTDGNWGLATIDPGTTTTYTDTCLGSGGRICYYRLTPPTGKTVTANVGC